MSPSPPPPPAPEVRRRVDAMVVACRAAGVKMTHQRLEIVREIAGSVEHPDAETVFRAVRARIPPVSLDTVYRTLWLLTDLGLVATLGPRRDAVRFDANLAPHHHFVCVRCGLVRDFASPDLDAIAVPAALRRLGRAASTHVEVRGLCAACDGRPAAPAPPRRAGPRSPSTAPSTGRRPR